MKKHICIIVALLITGCGQGQKANEAGSDTAATPKTEVTTKPEEGIKVDAGQRTLLAGKLKYETFYGAPGFGEDTATDAKEPTYILHLDIPIHFSDSTLEESIEHSDNTPAYETVETIQVTPNSGEEITNALKNNKDKKVTIECTLYGAVNGHDHAPAITEKVFSVKELK